MKTLILAAGYAVRLKELTRDNPKPLLEVGWRKIIDRILDKVVLLNGAHPIYIVTNAKFFEKFRGWLEASKYREKVSLINDGTTSNDTRLGAIRDMEIAIKEKSINDDLLVIAGDNLFDLDLKKFTFFASAKPGGISIAVHDIKDLSSATRFGVIKLDLHNRIIDFEEKPLKPKSTLISTGVYYFPKGKLSYISEYIRSSDKVDAPGYYIRWLVEKGLVYGFTFSGGWYDIGDMESYVKADREYSKKGEFKK